MSVRVTIDQLVLEGVAPGDRALVTRLFHQELSTLLLEEPPQTAHQVGAAAPPPLHAQGPAELARQAARAVHQTLTGGPDEQ